MIEPNSLPSDLLNQAHKLSDSLKTFIKDNGLDANSVLIPEGWVLVPIEPTRQMMAQGHFAMGGTDRGKFRRIYQAMVAAAPRLEG